MTGTLPVLRSSVPSPGARGLLALLGFLLSLFLHGSALAAPPLVDLLVQNERSSTMQVAVDGRSVGTVAAGSDRVLRLSPGLHRVTVRTGAGQVVVQQDVVMRFGPRIRVVVPPLEGWLTVQNGTGRKGTLLLDGQSQGELVPGADRTFARRPGMVDIRLVEGGRELARGTVTVGEGARVFFQAQAPRIADARLVNPLVVPVLVSVDGRPQIHLSSREERLLTGLPVGSVSVKATLLDGLTVVDARIQVRAYEVAFFPIPVPTRGRVDLANLSARPVDVLEDGRPLARVHGRGPGHVDLPVGRHFLVLREVSTGRELGVRIEVEPCRVVKVRFDVARRDVQVTRRAPGSLEDLETAPSRDTGPDREPQDTGWPPDPDLEEEGDSDLPPLPGKDEEWFDERDGDRPY